MGEVSHRGLGWRMNRRVSRTRRGLWCCLTRHSRCCCCGGGVAVHRCGSALLLLLSTTLLGFFVIYAEVGNIVCAMAIVRVVCFPGWSRLDREGGCGGEGPLLPLYITEWFSLPHGARYRCI